MVASGAGVAVGVVVSCGGDSDIVGFTTSAVVVVVVVVFCGV